MNSSDEYREPTVAEKRKASAKQWIEWHKEDIAWCQEMIATMKVEREKCKSQENKDLCDDIIQNYEDQIQDLRQQIAKRQATNIEGETDE